MGLVVYGSKLREDVVESFATSCPRCRSVADHEQRRQTRTWSVFFVRVPFIKRSADYLLCTRCGTEKSYRDFVDLGSPRVKSAFTAAFVAATVSVGFDESPERTMRVLSSAAKDRQLVGSFDGIDLDAAIADFKEVASPVVAADLVREVLSATEQIVRRDIADRAARDLGGRLHLPTPTIDEIVSNTA